METCRRRRGPAAPPPAAGSGPAASPRSARSPGIGGRLCITAFCDDWLYRHLNIQPHLRDPHVDLACVHNTHTRKRTHAHTRRHARRRTRTHAHTHTQACTQARRHAGTHAGTHTQTHKAPFRRRTDPIAVLVVRSPRRMLLLLRRLLLLLLQVHLTQLLLQVRLAHDACPSGSPPSQIR